MTLVAKHSKVVTIPDDPNYPVGTSEWNADHPISGTINPGDYGLNNLYGGTAPNSTLSLFGTSNASPVNDVVSVAATFIDIHPDVVPGGNNFARFSSGTGSNGEGVSLSMYYRNLDNSAPPQGRELGFWQLKAWDGTQNAPAGNPLAIVYGVSEPGGWTTTKHGSVIFFQTVPNGTASAVNEFSVGNGITALPGGSGEVQGNGVGTVTAGASAGYYIGSKQVLTSTGIGLGGAAASATTPLTIGGTTITDTNQGVAIGSMTGTLTYTSASSLNMFGNVNTVTINGANAGTNNNAYANFYQTNISPSGGTLSNVYTFRIRNNTGVSATGTVGNLAGVAVEPPAVGATPALTITSTFGFRIANQAMAGVTQGTVYGLWVDTQTNGTSNYLAWFNGTNPVAIQNSGLGYATGAGGTVTQATSKATGVTLSKASGQITMNAAALAAGTIVSFVLTNTAIAATDVLILNHISGGTPGSYSLNAQCAAGSATINVRNNTAGSLSEAVVIQYALIKAVNA